MSAWAPGTFEYQTRRRGIPMFQAELNRWGDAGWELCAVLELGGGYLYTFRRSAKAAQAWAERMSE